jgi:hypothetical protein
MSGESWTASLESYNGKARHWSLEKKIRMIIHRDFVDPVGIVW